MSSEIRTMNPKGFRSGQWARLTGAATDPENDRKCFTVEFPDGATDFWVMNDPDGQYEFRGSIS